MTTSAFAKATPNDGVTFIGNATTLIRYAGFNVLTDPNFLHAGERVQLGFGLNSKRLTNPAMEIADLPTLDAVVLSHLHEDHFDRRVAEQLDKRTLIVTTLGAAAGLAKLGFENTRALETWQSTTLEKEARTLTVTAAPAQHGPALVARAMPETMGSVLEFGSVGSVDYRVYQTGDTLIFEGIDEIPRRYPELDLMLLHLGGTKVLGVTVTMNGAQGADMVRRIKAAHVLPIHFNDYTVFRSPIEDFMARVKAGKAADRVHQLMPGETYRFEPAGGERQRRAG